MKALYIPLSLICACSIIVIYTGCETRSATESVQISPDSITIREGESVQFTAQGGYEYEWSLEHEGWGYLSNRRGNTTTYRSIYSPTLTEDGSGDYIQELTVVSTVSDNAATNEYSQSGKAYIRHQPYEPESTSTNGNAKAL